MLSLIGDLISHSILLDCSYDSLCLLLEAF